MRKNRMKNDSPIAKIGVDPAENRPAETAAGTGGALRQERRPPAPARGGRQAVDGEAQSAGVQQRPHLAEAVCPSA